MNACMYVLMYDYIYVLFYVGFDYTCVYIKALAHD